MLNVQTDFLNNSDAFPVLAIHSVHVVVLKEL